MDRFINFSNHPLSQWSDKQIQAARDMAVELEDFPFPYVSPSDHEEELDQLADQCVKQILEREPSVVMCQGEFTLCFRVVIGLKNAGIRVVSACSERCVIEQTMEGGVSRKTSEFVFVQFREY